MLPASPPILANGALLWFLAGLYVAAAVLTVVFFVSAPFGHRTRRGMRFSQGGTRDEASVSTGGNSKQDAIVAPPAAPSGSGPAANPVGPTLGLPPERMNPAATEPRVQATDRN